MTPDKKTVERLGAYLVGEADWLTVETIDRGDGRYDVAIIVDGTWMSRESALQAADYHRRTLDSLLTSIPAPPGGRGTGASRRAVVRERRELGA
jgi:hypothetical protein